MTTYEFWKSLNLCPACHKHSPKHGVLCDACIEKRKAQRPAAKKARPVLWNCYRCNKPTEQNGSLCNSCYQKLIIPSSFQKKRTPQI